MLLILPISLVTKGATGKQHTPSRGRICTADHPLARFFCLNVRTTADPLGKVGHVVAAGYLRNMQREYTKPVNSSSGCG